MALIFINNVGDDGEAEISIRGTDRTDGFFSLAEQCPSTTAKSVIDTPPLRGIKFHRIVEPLDAGIKVPDNFLKVEDPKGNLLNGASCTIPQGGCLTSKVENPQNTFIFTVNDDSDGYNDGAIKRRKEKGTKFGISIPLWDAKSGCIANQQFAAGQTYGINLLDADNVKPDVLINKNQSINQIHCAAYQGDADTVPSKIVIQPIPSTS